MKIIITFHNNWNDDIEKDFIKDWQDIKLFAEFSQLVGYLIIIVVEKLESTFKFNNIVFDEEGNYIKEIDIVSDKK